MSSRCQSRFRPGVEPLESRCLLSGGLTSPTHLAVRAAMGMGMAHPTHHAHVVVHHHHHHGPQAGTTPTTTTTGTGGMPWY